MAKTQNGAEFVATVRLSDKDNITVVDVGGTCEGLASDALAWAIATGRAVAASDAPEPTTTKGRAR